MRKAETKLVRRNFLIVVAIAGLFAACQKPPIKPPQPPEDGHPQMIYKDLAGNEVAYLHPKAVDMDNNGSADLKFGVQLVGDPLLQRDRWQFLVNSRPDRNLLNDANDQSPVLNKMDNISLQMAGYTWYQVSSILLAEKIVTKADTFWDGAWKDASHRYLPVQLKKQGKLYHGWIELSFDKAGEKLILHRSGLSKEAEKTVKAGY